MKCSIYGKDINSLFISCQLKFEGNVKTQEFYKVVAL